MNKRLEEIQIARAIAMIAVLCVHTTSTGITDLSKDSTYYFAYTFFNSFGKLGVPVFFMLSALVLFYSYVPKPFSFEMMKSFYKKRLKFILVPYFTISLLYFFVKWHLYYDYPSFIAAAKVFVNQLLLGKAYPHLYFLYVLIQFYMLFPILLFLFKRFPKSIPYYVIIGIAIQWIWVYINKNYLQVPYKGSLFLSYISFFTLGAVWGSNYMQIKEWFLKHSKQFKATWSIAAILLFTCSLFAISFFDYLNLTNQWSPYKEKINPFINSYLAEYLWASYGFISCIAIVVVSAILDSANIKKLHAFCLNLAAASFGIYLLHPLFLIELRKIQFTTSIGFHLWQISTFIIILVMSWLVTNILTKKTKYHWILIGK